MKATLLLCLLLPFLPQTQTEPTVALIFRDRTQIVKLSEARAEYETLRNIKALTATERSRHDAIVTALQTIPSRCTAGQVYASLCPPQMLDPKEKQP